jgi:predicted nucleotidyltransferase
VGTIEAVRQRRFVKHIVQFARRSPEENLRQGETFLGPRSPRCGSYRSDEECRMLPCSVASRPYHPTVHPLIAQNRAALAELCRRHHARSLDLFGSAASGDFDPATSDLDFLVEFEDLEPGAFSAAYFGLLEGLHDLFRREVDLVVESSIDNPYFRESIERTRTPLYAA